MILLRDWLLPVTQVLFYMRGILSKVSASNTATRNHIAKFPTPSPNSAFLSTPCLQLQYKDYEGKDLLFLYGFI